MSRCHHRFKVFLQGGSLLRRTCEPDPCKEVSLKWGRRSSLVTSASTFQSMTHLLLNPYNFLILFCVSIIWFRQESSPIGEFGLNCKFLPQQGTYFWFRWKIRVNALCWEWGRGVPRIRRNWLCCQYQVLQKLQCCSQCSAVAQKCTRSEAFRKTRRAQFSCTILVPFSMIQKSKWWWNTPKCNSRLEWLIAESP